MGEDIWAVVIQGYGTVLGKPVLRMGNLVELRDPRSLIEMRSAEKKMVWYDCGIIIGKPKSLIFPSYFAAHKVEDDDILKKYFESVTGLQLAPSGLKLV